MCAASTASPSSPLADGNLPCLDEQGLGSGLVAAGIERATALEQVTHAGRRSCRRQGWLHLVEQGMRFREAPTQRERAGDLGQQFESIVTRGRPQRFAETALAGGWIRVLPQDVDVERTCFRRITRSADQRRARCAARSAEGFKPRLLR
jgi:hypothetical protein